MCFDMFEKIVLNYLIQENTYFYTYLQNYFENYLGSMDFGYILEVEVVCSLNI